MTRPYPSKRKFTHKKSSKKSRKKTPVEPLVLKKLKMVLQQKLMDDINQEEVKYLFLKCW